LAHAQAGIYPLTRIEGLSQARLTTFFQKGRGRQQGKVRVRDVLRRPIRFRLINLMDRFAVEQQDVIFCRNVIIYFDKQTKRRLLDKFANALVDGGYLFVGHSESLHQVTDRFQLIGNTIYRKLR
jgi:chemotaxis protein methyltransferase CheR